MSGDNKLSTCTGQDSESCEEKFCACTASESDQQPIEEEQEPGDSLEPPPLKTRPLVMPFALLKICDPFSIKDIMIRLH